MHTGRYWNLFLFLFAGAIVHSSTTFSISLYLKVEMHNSIYQNGQLVASILKQACSLNDIQMNELSLEKETMKKE